MSLSGRCKLHQHSSGGNIYIPSNVMQDSRFPLNPEDDLKVTIEGNRIIISVVE